MGIFDEFKRLAHPYEDEEEDDFDDFDISPRPVERRERTERSARSEAPVTEEERRNPALLQADFSERHGHQLACYARAVTGLYGSPPDAVFIYSLPLGRCIPIALPGRSDRR